jgi:SAM-dependent methyltransferase
VSAPPHGARSAPAALRNREPILEVLQAELPSAGRVLEIAAGTGEHAVWFAQGLPHLEWRPTDREPAALASIQAWREAAALPNLREPLGLDAAEPEAWPVQAVEAVVSINMIHISPWRSAVGLFAGAARILPAGGVLVLYGPFQEGGRHTAPSNAAFDADLRARDPEWGVRDLDMVTALAAEHGFALRRRVAMPANNLSVVFAKD